jgi:GT2 family glycosyltransferase
MDLSIIIVNWNSTDYLRQCLASVHRETKGISFEIIVVDNASSDDSCARLVRDEYPGVVLHCSRDNLGFARGSNLGHELSRGDVLLFLNPDTEIRGDVFTDMVGELKSGPNIGAAGARLLNSDGSLQTSCVLTYPTIVNQLLDSELLRIMLPTSRLWGMKSLFASDSEPAKVDGISGACLMVKREVFSRVGGFDARYFMYVEDIDLCRRITRAGYAIHYIGSCEVVHHGGKSSVVQGRYFANVHQQEALVQFFRVTNGSWYASSYRVMLAVAAGLRVLVIGCLFPFLTAAHTATGWRFSFQKWSSIFRWAIGLEG